jgi:nickel-type superoxide dismutase maturation protease
MMPPKQGFVPKVVRLGVADTIVVRMRLRRALVTGPSMVPTLRHGDQILVRLGRPRRLRRGRLVLAEMPGAPLVVKRLVRLADDGKVWLEGDNPLGSTDSRTLGLLEADVLRGVVVARLWPRPARLRSARPGHAASSH